MILLCFKSIFPPRDSVLFLNEIRSILCLQEYARGTIQLPGGIPAAICGETITFLSKLEFSGFKFHTVHRWLAFLRVIKAGLED